MSAWLVCQEHIDVLVTAAIALKVIEREAATATGEMLWQENAESLRYRYEDAETFWELPPQGSYGFTARGVEDLYYVAQQLNCYNYQACEHPGYEGSDAYALVSEMLSRIKAVLGEDYRTHPNYDKATWGVEVKPDGTLWLDQTEYWTWFHSQARA